MISGADTERVGVLAPSGRDAPLTVAQLQASGFSAQALSGVEDLAAKMFAGELALAVVAEEALKPTSIEPLKAALGGQPPWSDFPVVLLSGHPGLERCRPYAWLAPLGNVTVLDRPVRVRTLVTAVSAALRSRRRQYQARREIVQRDRFLAMLGHELRNPLGAIVFAAEGMKSSRDQERLVETVQRQSRHLTRLVDDLLDVSRVTSGRIQLARSVVDLEAVLERTLATLQPWVRSQRISVRVEPPDQPLRVLGDEVRLEQIFNNLLTNALKYTPPEGKIEIHLGAMGVDAEVRIRDNGIGLEPHMKERIFELFAQAETALDRARGGLGLGLTLVRSLVELHGGTVSAQSEGLGKGAELTVRLPRTQLEARASYELELDDLPAMDLALVEDNPDIRESLQELLESEGHRVAAAADGRDGLALITRQHPELAFIDLGLPGLDGYQVARGVRAKLGSSVWLVALSGYGQPEDRERALSAGFDAHLTKPVDIEGLKSAMRAARRADPPEVVAGSQ